MRTLLRWLRLNGELVARDSVLGFLPVTVRIVDAEYHPVVAVNVGERFLHSIEVGENISPHHIEVEISNHLNAVNQIRFVQDDGSFGSSWGFVLELDPEERGEERSTLAECHRRTSGSSTIRTDVAVTTNPTECGAIPLEVTIA